MKQNGYVFVETYVAQTLSEFMNTIILIFIRRFINSKELNFMRNECLSTVFITQEPWVAGLLNQLINWLMGA